LSPEFRTLHVDSTAERVKPSKYHWRTSTEAAELESLFWQSTFVSKSHWLISVMLWTSVVWYSAAPSIYGLLSGFKGVPLDRPFQRLDTMPQFAVRELPAFLLAGFAASLFLKRKRHGQGDRDRRAQLILTALENGVQPKPFALYLRAFRITNKLDREYEGYHKNPFSGSDFKLDFEALLAEALDQDFPLIALGKPGEAVGAGRVELNDQTWQPAVKLLAQAAQCIVVIPSDTQGTLWELEWLFREQFLQKTLILNVNDDWSEAAVQASAIGLQLPLQLPPDSAIALDSTGTLLAMESLKAKSTVADVRDVIRKMRSHLNEPRESPAVQIQQQKLLQRAAALEPSGNFGRRCPHCGSTRFRDLKDHFDEDVRDDRICEECGAQYSTPPKIGNVITMVVIIVLCVVIERALLQGMTSPWNQSPGWFEATRTWSLVIIIGAVGIGCTIAVLVSMHFIVLAQKNDRKVSSRK
jgi:uncharacterized protein (DUF983 family)